MPSSGRSPLGCSSATTSAAVDGQRRHRPALCVADDRGRPDPADALRPASPIGVNIAYRRWAILLALLFVTLPFVVRTVQPVLLELDADMEEAARSLGATGSRSFGESCLPNLLPGILSGVALAFARALGEIGSVVISQGTTPSTPRSPPSSSSPRSSTGYPDFAAAVAMVLLVISFALLLAVGVLRFLATRHERA